MKIDELARPGLIALGVAGLAGTALLGFAAGLVVARDPEALLETPPRVAPEAARAPERASLLAAQAREQVGDLWAEAREEALAEVDAADFERAATGVTSASGDKRPRKRASRAREPNARKAAGKAPARHAADQS